MIGEAKYVSVFSALTVGAGEADGPASTVDTL